MLPSLWQSADDGHEHRLKTQVLGLCYAGHRIQATKLLDAFAKTLVGTCDQACTAGIIAHGAKVAGRTPRSLVLHQPVQSVDPLQLGFAGHFLNALEKHPFLESDMRFQFDTDP